MVARRRVYPYALIFQEKRFTAPVNGYRFVRGEPQRRVHECVFGVLALESEPGDPRL